MAIGAYARRLDHDRRSLERCVSGSWRVAAITLPDKAKSS